MKTFVVRLYEDAGSDPAGPVGAAAARLCGVIDEVATGLRATFRSEIELVAVLKTAIGAEPPAPD